VRGAETRDSDLLIGSYLPDITAEIGMQRHFRAGDTPICDGMRSYETLTL
jgi:hypothetical protein